MKKVKQIVKQKMATRDNMAIMNGNLDTKNWQRVDLNHRPKAYESSALPLSYAASKQNVA